MLMTLADLFGARPSRVEPVDVGPRNAEVAVPWAIQGQNVQSVVELVRRPRTTTMAQERAARTAAQEHDRPATVEQQLAAAAEQLTADRLESALEALRRAMTDAHQAELASAVEAARAEGEAAGFEAGCAAGRAERDPELTAFEAELGESVRLLAETSETLAKMAREDAAELGFELARAVVGTALDTSPEALAAVLERALEAVPHLPVTTILCHSKDLELVTAQVARHPGLTERRVGVEASTTIARGGCRVVLSNGTVESNGHTFLETLIRAVRQRLLEPTVEAP